MAMVIIGLRIMPESPDVNLEDLKSEIFKQITDLGGNPKNSELQEVAFGLKALNVTFAIDENKGGTDPVEEAILAVEGVQNVEVTSVSRALG
jgi:elongation factor 1-beta